VLPQDSPAVGRDARQPRVAQEQDLLDTADRGEVRRALAPAVRRAEPANLPLEEQSGPGPAASYETAERSVAVHGHKAPAHCHVDDHLLVGVGSSRTSAGPDHDCRRSGKLGEFCRKFIVAPRIVLSDPREQASLVLPANRDPDRRSLAVRNPSGMIGIEGGNSRSMFRSGNRLRLNR